ncbi:MAG: DUF4157 domain-containing protein [Cyanobacteria bacterium P01_G01_bin.54]
MKKYTAKPTWKTPTTQAKTDQQKQQVHQPTPTGNFAPNALMDSVTVAPTRELPLQPKLTMGEVGDQYEQEADQVAAQVVQRLNSPQAEQQEAAQGDEPLQLKSMLPEVQRTEGDAEEAEAADPIWRKPLVQLQGMNGGGSVSPEVEQSIQQEQGKGQPLADGVRQPMEGAFGADFGGVRVHTDNTADQLNQSIQAKAFTTGQDVFFRQGAYQPGSKGGQELLAHELTHVVQQRSSTVQRSGDELIQQGTTKLTQEDLDKQTSTSKIDEPLEDLDKQTSTSKGELLVERMKVLSRKDKVQHDGPAPGQVELYKWLNKFVEGKDTAPEKMNCWQAVLWAARSAGLIDSEHLKMANEPFEIGDSVNTLSRVIAKYSDQNSQLIHPNELSKNNEKRAKWYSENLPKFKIPRGEVVVFGSDGKHVCLSTGDGKAIELDKQDPPRVVKPRIISENKKYIELLEQQRKIDEELEVQEQKLNNLNNDNEMDLDEVKREKTKIQIKKNRIKKKMSQEDKKELNRLRKSYESGLLDPNHKTNYTKTPLSNEVKEKTLIDIGKKYFVLIDGMFWGKIPSKQEIKKAKEEQEQLNKKRLQKNANTVLISSLPELNQFKERETVFKKPPEYIHVKHREKQQEFKIKPGQNFLNIETIQDFDKINLRGGDVLVKSTQEPDVLEIIDGHHRFIGTLLYAGVVNLKILDKKGQTTDSWSSMKWLRHPNQDFHNKQVKQKDKKQQNDKNKSKKKVVKKKEKGCYLWVNQGLNLTFNIKEKFAGIVTTGVAPCVAVGFDATYKDQRALSLAHFDENTITETTLPKMYKSLLKALEIENVKSVPEGAVEIIFHLGGGNTGYLKKLLPIIMKFLQRQVPVTCKQGRLYDSQSEEKNQAFKLGRDNGFDKATDTFNLDEEKFATDNKEGQARLMYLAYSSSELYRALMESLSRSEFLDVEKDDRKDYGKKNHKQMKKNLKRLDEIRGNPQKELEMFKQYLEHLKEDEKEERNKLNKKENQVKNPKTEKNKQKEIETKKSNRSIRIKRKRILKQANALAAKIKDLDKEISRREEELKLEEKLKSVE